MVEELLAQIHMADPPLHPDAVELRSGGNAGLQIVHAGVLEQQAHHQRGLGKAGGLLQADRDRVQTRLLTVGQIDRGLKLAQTGADGAEASLVRQQCPGDGQRTIVQQQITLHGEFHPADLADAAQGIDDARQGQ